MSKLRVLILGFLIICQTSAFAVSNEGRGGGGGIYKDGIYMTFGTAGIYVDPTPYTEVPGLKLLEKVLLSLPLNLKQRSLFIDAMSASGRREYFRVVEDSLTEEMRKKFLEEYSKVVKQPIDNLKVFAFTEPYSQKTYLLPEFFKLKESEQAAILFHEGLWIIEPNLTYHSVIAAEISFQLHIEHFLKGRNDVRFGRKLAELLEDNSITLNMALSEDIRNGTLASLGVNEDGIPVGALLNPSADQCSNARTNILVGEGNRHLPFHLNSESSIAHFVTLMHRFPNSQLLAELSRIIRTEPLTILVEKNENENKDSCKKEKFRKQKIAYFKKLKFHVSGKYWDTGYDDSELYTIAKPAAFRMFK